MPVNADKDNLQDNLAERQRALLALLKTADGKWTRAGVATKLLSIEMSDGHGASWVSSPRLERVPEIAANFAVSDFFLNGAD